MDMPPRLLTYDVRYMTEADIPSVLALFKSNPLYFRYCPPPPSVEGIRQAMEERPNGISKKNKHFVGIWQGTSLVAVLDLLEGYPHPGIAWIGLFMLDISRQGRELGTRMMDALCDALKGAGFTSIRLGYAKGNQQAACFWKKNGFMAAGKESTKEGDTVVIAEKLLF